MPEIDAYKVDAFTERAFGGNPAGVVPDAQDLADAQMQAIAREMNLSETGFVLPATRPDADLRLRYFSPTEEVPLCGHATVATFHLLAELGRIQRGATTRIETRVGVLPVDVRENGCVFLGGDALSYAPSPVDDATLARLLGVAPEEVEGDAMLVRGDLFVRVRGLKTMEAMRPDFGGIGALAAQGVQGVAPVSFETRTEDAMTHLRYFAPAVGIPEDPVTGAAHIALAGYLVRTGHLHTKCVFIGEQGDFCGRPGRVQVEVAGTREVPVIRVGGTAVTVMRGRMIVPD